MENEDQDEATIKHQAAVHNYSSALRGLSVLMANVMGLSNEQMAAAILEGVGRGLAALGHEVDASKPVGEAFPDLVKGYTFGMQVVREHDLAAAQNAPTTNTPQ